MPSCRPIYPLPGFPSNHLHPVVEAVRLSSDFNALLSLHISTAVLLVIFAQTRTRRILAILYLIGTALASPATGEQYIIDLIIGVPFACFAASVAYRRIGTAVGHLGLVMARMIAIRTTAPVFVRRPGFLKYFAALTWEIVVRSVTRSWSDPEQRQPK